MKRMWDSGKVLFIISLLLLVYMTGRWEYERSSIAAYKGKISAHAMAEARIKAMQPEQYAKNGLEFLRGWEEEFGGFIKRDGKIFVRNDYALARLEDYLVSEYPNGDVDIVLTDKMTDSDTRYLAQLIMDRDVYSPENGKNFRFGAPVQQTGISVSYLNRYVKEGGYWAHEPCVGGNVPPCMSSLIVNDYLSRRFYRWPIGRHEYLARFTKNGLETLDYYVYEFYDEFDVAGREQRYSPMSIYIYLDGIWQNDQKINQILEIPMERVSYWAGHSTFRFQVFQKDLNADGMDDLLLYTGNSEMTGRLYQRYCGYIWDEETGEFVLFESMPSFANGWDEDNTIYCDTKMDSNREFWSVYELVNGEYVESRTEIEKLFPEDIWVQREYRDDVLIGEHYNADTYFAPSHWDQ